MVIFHSCHSYVRHDRRVEVSKFPGRIFSGNCTSAQAVESEQQRREAGLGRGVTWGRGLIAVAGVNLGYRLVMTET